MCAEAIDGHAVTNTACRLGSCPQQWVRGTRALCDGCVLGHQCLPPVLPPAPLQPQAQPGIKMINVHASKVYPPRPLPFSSCFPESVCISSGTEVLCQLSNIAQVCVCWRSMAIITIQLKRPGNLVPCRCRLPLTRGNTSSNSVATCPGLVLCAQEPEFLGMHPIPKFPTLL